MFNRFWHDIWILMFVLLIFVGIFSGQALVIGLGVMGLLVALVSWLWNRLSLEEVHYEREIEQTRVFRGEETKLTISLTNRKPVPLGKLDLEDEYPEEIEIVGAEVTPSSNPKSMIMRLHTSISWYERIRWEYTIKCNERGFYRFGPARLESGDLFGFFESETTHRATDYLLVYPQSGPAAAARTSAAQTAGRQPGRNRDLPGPVETGRTPRVPDRRSAEDHRLEEHGQDGAAPGTHV